MKAVIQRAKQAGVTVEERTVGKIDSGLVVLLGVGHEDTTEDAKYLANKIVSLRIFEDGQEKMNLSLKDIGGSVLSISQFTLYADTRKGRRPNFMHAAKPGPAKQLYEVFNQFIEESGINVETGTFGADMQVHLINDGPVTLLLDSSDRR
ncbi:D-tyrosyl-tRNA(Tyr) deacylase [Sediminibacillus dalangtanensis]|uniref:D-aminoacyl-tRNA deacylase n=1 Tax=Sediminibacillus dalangtanensis TaxID=2729421 RepID=A0ABX7VVX2_9BACI|nr:D-aminoacyl-tRNA deacylase [Sediminibacillus dalangtanensis]QTM99925.1 D-tyrosyl-tRNA(Tyr) deacylase [Sediminibacillus dalangtanensis]